MRFLVSNFIHRVSGQGSDKSMGGPKGYDVCHIFVHTGCLTNVTHRMLLKPQKLTKIKYCGIRYSNGHDLDALDPSLS